ncbi:clumping factor A [Babesia caballi]|uniref:Ribosome quality control complex subunit 2 n=1 Tax=Babesia caballi TaxID=5871 RepID=A0AAV4M055_BABCB|nr:clumping factor A [Babesia caballi]
MDEIPEWSRYPPSRWFSGSSDPAAPKFWRGAQEARLLQQTGRSRKGVAPLSGMPRVMSQLTERSKLAVKTKEETAEAALRFGNIFVGALLSRQLRRVDGPQQPRVRPARKRSRALLELDAHLDEALAAAGNSAERAARRVERQARRRAARAGLTSHRSVRRQINLRQMVRERLNAVDVAAVVGNLQKQILDYNLVNIYDVTSRIYVLKFSRNEDKKFVLFEIGHRIHTTQFLRNTDHLPSNFNVKLRKHLRTRKLRSVRQVSQDRVVDFTFSSGEYAYHLIVQFFLPGNVYLTDYAYKVLTVLRPQNAGEAFFKVGQTYEIPETRVPWGVAVPREVIEQVLLGMKGGAVSVVAGASLSDEVDGKGGKGGKGKGQKRADDAAEGAGEFKDDSVHALLKSIFPSVHVTLMDHVLKEAMGDEHMGSKSVDALDRARIEESVEAIRKVVVSVAHSAALVPGFLYRGAQEYEDFSPFDVRPNAERFDDFNEALDAYFTQSEMKKIEKQEQPKKPIKLKKIKDDQDKRETKRQKEIEKLARDIELVETNRVVFDSVLDLLRTLVASGASWREITDQLAQQRESGHPLARHIRSVNIPDRRVDVCLPSEDTGFYGSGPSLQGRVTKKSAKKDGAAVEFDEASATLDYGLTCFQNLEIMYASKKRLAEKLERTRIGRDFALKRVDHQKEKEKQKKAGKSVSLTKVRKRMWFEKFHWFISSDGYLVLGGRDSTQNELLVKRYLTAGDLYFHAEVHGAASCILKNPKRTAESHPATIEEAACFAICLSSAWNEKMVVPAWWVHHHQVSRSAPTGEYLPHGSFMIRGKKNYVQPQRLEMAIGVVFHIEAPQLGADEPEPALGEDVEAPVVEASLSGDALGEELEGVDVPHDASVSDVGGQGAGGDQMDGGDDVKVVGGDSDEGEDLDDDYDVDDELNELLDDDEDTDESDESSDDEDTDESDESSDDGDTDDEDCSSGERASDVDDMSPSDDGSDDLEGAEGGAEESEADVNVEGGLSVDVGGGIAGQGENSVQTEEIVTEAKNESTRKSVAFGLDDSEKEPANRLVRFDTAQTDVKTVEVSGAQFRRTKQRRPTGYMCRGVDINEMLQQMQTLGLVDLDAPGVPEAPDATGHAKASVRFVEPEKVNNPPSVAKKLLSRLPTGIPGKGKQQARPSKLAQSKAARAKKKYGDDDEEIQELRLRLTGSKALKHVAQQAVVAESADKVEDAGTRPTYQREPIKPLDARELSSHMQQLRMLSKDPSGEDVIVSAVPMCAPYSALKSHPYHLKLVPGSTKKGAIAAQAVQHFLKVDEAKAQYVKLITTDQFALTLIENCKIPGSAHGARRA